MTLLSLRNAIAGSLAAIGLIAAPAVQAEVFTIDTSQSYLSIVVGVYDDTNFAPLTTPQVAVPPSNSTALGGTLNVLGGIGGIGVSSAAISFANQSTDMSPLPGGGLPGAAPANYGVEIDLNGLVSGPGAIRGTTADLSLATTDIIGNVFDSDGALVSILTGLLDVNLTGFTTIETTIDISGNSGSNTAGFGSITVVGTDGELLIPLFVEALVPVEIAPGAILPLVARFEGQILATGTVVPIPEPASVVLLGLAAVGLCVAGRRRLNRG